MGQPGGLKETGFAILGVVLEAPCKNRHDVEARSKQVIITIKPNTLNNMRTPFCAVVVTQTSPKPMF